jgi:hypothetical protein
MSGSHQERSDGNIIKWIVKRIRHARIPVPSLHCPGVLAQAVVIQPIDSLVVESVEFRLRRNIGIRLLVETEQLVSIAQLGVLLHPRSLYAHPH